MASTREPRLRSISSGEITQRTWPPSSSTRSDVHTRGRPRPRASARGTSASGTRIPIVVRFLCMRLGISLPASRMNVYGPGRTRFIVRYASVLT
jgi:hypothetical protein